jgi:hypothetical protein
LAQPVRVTVDAHDSAPYRPVSCSACPPTT